MRKSIIYNENCEFSKEKLEMKKEALKIVFSSSRVILKKIDEKSLKTEKIKIPVFTPLFRMKRAKEY